jgi:hypothetical protein
LKQGSLLNQHLMQRLLVLALVTDRPHTWWLKLLLSLLLLLLLLLLLVELPQVRQQLLNCLLPEAVFLLLPLPWVQVPA